MKDAGDELIEALEGILEACPDAVKLREVCQHDPGLESLPMTPEEFIRFTGDLLAAAKVCRARGWHES